MMKPLICPSENFTLQLCSFSTFCLIFNCCLYMQPADLCKWNTVDFSQVTNGRQTVLVKNNKKTFYVLDCLFIFGHACACAHKQTSLQNKSSVAVLKAWLCLYLGLSQRFPSNFPVTKGALEAVKFMRILKLSVTHHVWLDWCAIIFQGRNDKDNCPLWRKQWFHPFICMTNGNFTKIFLVFPPLSLIFIDP